MYAQFTARFWGTRTLRVVMGEEGFRRWNGRRRDRFYRRAGVVYLHVPKAAGSSLSEALYGRRLGHATAEELATFSAGAWDDLPRFSVLRDPFTRLASAYRFVMSGGTPEGAVRFRWVYRTATFSSFERFVKDWLARVDLAETDVVFWPQSRFVSRGGKPDPGIELFVLEEPDRLRTYLAGLGVDRLPVRNRAATAEALRYDAEMEAVVRRVYAQDLALHLEAGQGTRP